MDAAEVREKVGPPAQAGCVWKYNAHLNRHAPPVPLHHLCPASPPLSRLPRPLLSHLDAQSWTGSAFASAPNAASMADLPPPPPPPPTPVPQLPMPSPMDFPVSGFTTGPAADSGLDGNCIPLIALPMGAASVGPLVLPVGAGAPLGFLGFSLAISLRRCASLFSTSFLASTSALVAGIAYMAAGRPRPRWGGRAARFRDWLGRSTAAGAARGAEGRVLPLAEEAGPVAGPRGWRG